ncbi:hypothetical protein [uncultured Photobacterium sp.]|jgi:hypothetical protein|uniref:hypothetical protein n=1 Tax=uncultured Photobacterium sp. TaxID=173973 RepID=UPI00263331D1|nr:hypothetical protein [uncultured Photobacterium sp.]
MDDFLDDYDDIVSDLISSNYSTFEEKLKQYISYCTQPNEMNFLLSEKLPPVDFESWYEKCKSTQGSWVGSGELSWPLDKLENLSMRFELLKYIAEGKTDVPDFCCSFMYSENNFNIMVMEFNDQIVEPLARDLRKIFTRSSGLKNTVSPIPVELIKASDNWYQRPIGLIGIGLFISILGGVATAKVLGAL